MAAPTSYEWTEAKICFAAVKRFIVLIIVVDILTVYLAAWWDVI